MSKNFIVETLGSFLFILVILSTANAAQFAPFAIAGALMFCIYAFGQVSGGHFNPAVSVAAWVRGVLPAKELPYYIGAQVLGGILAALVSTLLFSTGGNSLVNMMSKAEIASKFGAIMLVEFIVTFALCIVVLMVATSPKVKDNSFYGFAIGLVVFAGAVVFSGVSGGAFNPAVALSLNLPQIFHDTSLITNFDVMGLVTAYLLPQFVAGALAGITYKYVMDEFVVKAA